MSNKKDKCKNDCLDCSEVKKCETLTSLKIVNNSLVYKDEHGHEKIIPLPSDFNETLTILSYNPTTNILTYQDENGDLTILPLNSILLQTNSVNNDSQFILNLVEGDGVIITDNGGGEVEISSGNTDEVLRFGVEDNAAEEDRYFDLGIYSFEITSIPDIDEDNDSGNSFLLLPTGLTNTTTNFAGDSTTIINQTNSEIEISAPTVLITQIAELEQPNVLYYDLSTGSVTYGTAPSGEGFAETITTLTEDPSGTFTYTSEDATETVFTIPEVPDAWLTLGNTGTDDTINYIGTNDSQNFVVKTDNTARFYFEKTYANLASYGPLFINAGNTVGDSIGTNIGIGTATGKAFGNITDVFNNAVAIGHFAHENGASGGGANVAIGSEALRAATVSYYTTAVGHLVGNTITTGIENTLYGAFVGTHLTTGSYNVAVGTSAMGFGAVPAGQSIACTVVGRKAMGEGYGTDCIAIGNEALVGVAAGTNNIGIGNGAGGVYAPGGAHHNNVFIGSQNSYTILTGVANVAIGSGVTDGLSTVQNFCQGTASYNVLLGRLAGGEGVTGNGNILIGDLAANNITGNRVSGDHNIVIGRSTGRVITGAANNIIIGSYSALPVDLGSRQLNIGNVIYGHSLYNTTTISNTPTDTGSIAIGITIPTARLHLPAGTATANTAPLKINIGTALTTPEDGAIEYHDDHLWFTTTGVRYKLDRQIDILKLRPAAGVATADGAPLKFASGTLVAVPENGSIEYDGTDFYYTSGGTRRTLGANNGTIGLTLDGGTDVITVGEKNLVIIPYDCVVTGWTIIGDTTGAIVVDVWNKVGGIPTVADTITGTQKPTITATNQYAESSDVSSWTTSLAANSILKFKVDSVTSFTEVALIIKIQYS